MATIVKSSEIKQYLNNPDIKLWVYNALDCCITGEVFDNLSKVVEERKTPIPAYKYEIETLDTAIECMVRGMKMDPTAVTEILDEQRAPRKKLQCLLDAISKVVVGVPINYRSSVQLKKLFYDKLAIDPIKKRDKGEVRVSTDRDALEKIASHYPRGQVIANTVLALKDIDSTEEVLTSKKDWDGRTRSSFKVDGTETWRWASRKSSFWSGMNLQNITESLRRAFVSDPGYVFFNADHSQADSRVVAFESQDKNYNEAINSGDLHTYVARMVWPQLPWTGNIKEDKAIAERLYYRHFTYRFMCKKAGHGSNYLLGPHSLARQLHILVRNAIRFNLMYLGGEEKFVNLERWHKQDPAAGFDRLIEEGKIIGAGGDNRIVEIAGAFPGIKVWQDTIRHEMQTTGRLVNLFGFDRNFWDRLSDDATIRKGVAFRPQSVVGILTSKALTRIRKTLGPEGVHVFGQVHDSVMGQLPIKRLDELAPAVLECCNNPLTWGGRTLTIPAELAIGKNWGKFNDDPKEGPINPEGLKKWS